MGVTGPPVFFVPHTHWDREWYEPEPRFRQRLTAMLDQLLAALESGAFRGPMLLDGQTALLHDYLEVRPEAEPRIRDAVAAGSLLIGPWFVLADELLSSDEALVRNLLIGSHDAGRFGRVLPVGYSPDAFGHPAALPTILNGFGIGTAVLWRGTGDHRHGDLFDWHAPDGARVLVHHLPPVGYEAGMALLSGSGGAIERWERVEAMVGGRNGGRPLLVPVGADHHRHPAALESVVQALGQRYPERQFQIASPEAYFAAVDGEATPAPVRGELREGYGYTWVLQGTHAIRAPLKAAIAEGDRLLRRWVEPLATLAWLRGGDDPRALIDAAWRLHLTNCCHDTICGCVADATAADAAARARSVTIQARGLLVDVLRALLGANRSRPRDRRDDWLATLAVVNPSPIERMGICEATLTLPMRDVPVGFPARPLPRAAPAGAQPALVTDAEDPVPLQVLERYRAWERIEGPGDYPVQREVEAVRVAMRTPRLPPLGVRCLRVRSARGPIRERLPAVRAERGVLYANRVTIRPGRDGAWSVLPEDGPAWTGFGRLTSDADLGDTYTYEPSDDAGTIRARWSRARTIWSGPLVAAVARDFDLGRVRGRMHVRLDAGSALIRLALDLVNCAAGHRLRIHLPVRSSAGCLVDMQYGPVWRAAASDADATAMEWPVRTAPMHRYAAVPGGPTVFARGLFEYELTAEGTIAVTLFRSVSELSRGDLRARPGHAAWPQPVPDAAVVGFQRAELAVALTGPGQQAMRERAQIERLAEEFHAPVSGLMVPDAVDPPGAVVGPRLEGEGLAFTALKPCTAGRAMILRCVNVTDRPVDANWVLPVPCKQAFRARLDERAVDTLRLEDHGRRIRFRAGSREVVTVRVEW